MFLLKKLTVILIFLLLASCASTYKTKVGFDKNEKIDTTHYKTFAWLTSGKILLPAEDLNPVMKLRVDQEIEQAFIAKGYTLVADAEKADFTISYTVGNRDKISVNHYPPTYNVGFGWGKGFYGSYFGGMFRTNLDANTHVRSYKEGKLAIDVYDVSSHEPTWHGWATKRISTREENIPLQVIKTTVNEVVAQFY